MKSDDSEGVRNNGRSENKKTQVKRDGSIFVNPHVKWPFGYVEGAIRMAKWLYSITMSSAARPNLESNLPVKKPYFLHDKEVEDRDVIRATWLGHASVLIYIDGFHILCDPVFGDQCPPPLGPRRFRSAPCKVKDLPEIDAVLISHNHYDHMDATTIIELCERFRDVQWLVPMNDKRTLRSIDNRIQKVHEMMWWDTFNLEKATKKLTIHFTPTQHWSNRGIRDAFKSLWGSWALVGSTHKFWFGGDTGYCEKLFNEIGDSFPYFDAAAIPIGAYEPRDLTCFQHCDPDEAVKIHQSIKSKRSFGIHWGTFRLTSEFYMDPKERLDGIVKDKPDVSFFTINHGETLEVINDYSRVYSGEEPTNNERRPPGFRDTFDSKDKDSKTTTNA